MNTPHLRSGRATRVAGTFLLGLFVFELAAQTAPRLASAKPETDSEPVKLSVFEVTDDKDLGYAASTALSGTRTNEKLENLPNSISVMTHEFIEDLALNNFFEAVGFAENAENVYNDMGSVGAPAGVRSGSQINFRGLASLRQLRDG